MQAERVIASTRELPFFENGFLELFVSKVPCAIFMIGKDLCFVAGSDEFKAFYGMEAVEINGRHLDELFPDIPGRWRTALSRAMQGEGSKCSRDLFIRADGTTHWLRWEILPYRHMDGSIAGGVGFLEKLDNEVSAEENLNFVLDSAEIGVWERDIIGNRLTFTAQAERLLGYEPGTLGNDPEEFDACVHPEDVKLLYASMETSIRERSPGKLKFRVIWPDGSIHWIYGLFECHFLEDGTPHRLRGASLDITESQEQAIALKRLTDTKSRFLANMSHEIRNPLNSVTLLSTLLEQEHHDEEKRKEFSRRIATATHTVVKILDDVLDISKMEAGQISLECAPFELKDILDDIQGLFMDKAEQKGIQLEVQPIQWSRTLLGDAHRVKQVLVNLVSNAIKFTGSGRVCIKTQHQRGEKDLLKLTFEVIDTGIGIDSDTVPLLFHPFSQGDSSITRKFGGTGLGLSISKSIAEMMGGTIEVESAPGLGSTFRFSVKIPIQMERTSADSEAQRTVTSRCLEGIRFLLVDDDRDNLTVMGDLLGTMGATSSLSLNGQDALECLRKSPEAFDVVLMDIQMPVMDGIEASRRIRNELLLDLPIIAVTAGVLRHQQQDAITAGITEVIRKPVDIESLITTIQRHYRPVAT